MVVVSYSGKEINAKLVYYGPGLSGKTTNLEYIYQSVPSTNRGKMVSMKTRTERTLFFDFLPVDLGEMGGFKTRFLLYTVPGQVYYNATRKLVLRGVDAIIFVADSARGKMDENLESLQNLHDNLKEYGLSLDNIPLVMQYNKRDVPDAYSVEELEQALNPEGWPYFEAVATTGQGVFEAFRGIARLLLQKLSKEIKFKSNPAASIAEEGPAAPAAAPKAPAPAPRPAAAAPPPPQAMPTPPEPRAFPGAPPSTPTAQASAPGAQPYRLQPASPNPPAPAAPPRQPVAPPPPPPAVPPQDGPEGFDFGIDAGALEAEVSAPPMDPTPAPSPASQEAEVAPPSMSAPTPPPSWDEDGEEEETLEEDRPGFWGRLFRRGRKQEEEFDLNEPEVEPEEESPAAWEAPATEALPSLEDEPRFSPEPAGSPALTGNWEEPTPELEPETSPAGTLREEPVAPHASITVDVPSDAVEEDEEDVQRVEVPVVLRADQLRAGARLQLVLEIRIVAGSASEGGTRSRVA